MPTAAAPKVCFGSFELDRQSGELFKLGHKLNLHGQPIEVLSILLEHPGDVVAREELCKRLWPEDTFVDFEHSLNTAIKKLRQALDDDPDAPRYIETLPKKGYRFVAQVEPAANSVEPLVAHASPSAESEAHAIAEAAAPRKSRRWTITAALILILAMGAAAVYRLYHPRTPYVTGIHQLTRNGRVRGAGYGIHQVVTDGTRVYFDDWVPGPGDMLRIGQISTKGGEISHLDLPQIPFPQLLGGSSDGSELLVVDGWSSGLDGALWQVPLPNGPPRKFGNTPVAVAALVPGTQSLVYSQGPHLRQLFVGSIDGTSHPLLTAPHEISMFVISPDAQRIRFEMSDQLWEASLDGTGLHRFLPQINRPMCCGAWGPDGRLYYFAVQEQGVWNLWVVTEIDRVGRKRAAQPLQLTFGPVSFTTPAFSRDGKQAFALGTVLSGELLVYDTASSRWSQFLGGISAGYVDFSRDGQWVTYVAFPENTLWRSRADGSQRLQLTFPPIGRVINPKWSPDGRLIAFTEWGAPEKKVYLVPADGGSPMLLLSGDLGPSDPTWSPDGKSIAYSGVSIQDGTGTEVRILDLETKQSRTIPGSQHMFSARWSPDGRYLAAQADDMSKLFLYSFATGRWKELAQPEAGGVGWPSWSHDSRFLYANLSNQRIYRFPVPEGPAQLMAKVFSVQATSPTFVGSAAFTLTPDDRILVLRDHSTDELYALDLEYR